jgi:polysaccharide export outer membrane protein
MNSGRGACQRKGRHRPVLSRAIRAVILLGAVALSFPAAGETAADGGDYKLAAGGRITVIVFGQPELSGDILVDGAGTIVLPLIEPLEVKGLTTFECQTLIRDRLASGILHHPAVAVRISEFRPVYLLGDVRAPGAYPFRYGSIVKSAVALAGGFGPAELIQSTAVSEFLLADERVHELIRQKQALLVRKARLEAQRDGLANFSSALLPAGAEKRGVEDAFANEKDTFETQLSILQGELDVLRSQKPRLQLQIDTNNKEIAAGTKQLDIIREQRNRSTRLLSQGLGTQNAEFQPKVLEANQESVLFRLMADVSRLHLNAGEIDVKIQETEASFKRQIVTELHEVRQRLGELEVALPAAQQLREVKAQQVAGSHTSHSATITRVQDGETSVFGATDATPLEPGDVVEITRSLSGPHEVASTRTTENRPQALSGFRTRARQPLPQ